MSHSHTRVHEPLALAALAAAAFSLHVLWILSLLVERIPGFAQTLTVCAPLGPVSGLYLLSIIVYIVVFIAVSLWFRGRDCMGARDAIFWFFLSSVVAFALLTVPFVSGFNVRIG